MPATPARAGSRATSGQTRGGARGRPRSPRDRRLRSSVRTCRRHRERDHLLARLAEPVDAELDDVAGLQVHRLRLHAEPDARRRAGADDVAGQQRHELADVADERRHVEDHVRGRAVLARARRSPSATCRSCCGSAISSRVARNGPSGAKRVAALALHPLAAALELERALRVVVVQRVAGDVLERLRPRRRSARALPITTASSTSQSTLVAPRGITSGVVRARPARSSP